MVYNYVNTGDLDDNLICCICRTPFNEPVTTRTCFHTFCQDCILQALSVSNHCPIDRSPLSIEHLGQADPIVRHLVEELIVRCPYLDAGCEYTGERHLLGSHLKLECPYVQVPCLCSDKNCKRTVARKEVLGERTVVHQESDHESDHARTMACEFCGKEFSHVSAIGDHVESSCPEKILPCDQAKNGCGWRGRRLSLKAHIDKCAYESIKGFFAIHDDRITRVSKDNERLRHKTEELEGVVRILKQELEWAKIALGPWYRPVYAERPPLATSCTRYPNDEGARVGPMLSRGTDTMTSDASDPERWVLDGTTEAFNFFDPFAFVGQTRNYDPDTHAGDNVSTTMIGTRAEQNLSTHTSHDGNTASESGTSNGLETIQDGAASVLGNNLQSTSTALFSYHFPSGNQVVFEEGGSSSRPQGWRHVLPPNSMPSNTGPGVQLPNQPPIPGSIHTHLASSHSVPCNRPQFTPSINKHVVAPLNLSTTVEGSLVGLRESLVTMSEALESQERRLELALSTEGLRVSEEVGSLKAVVQGLRMQVHAIMMDRNALVTGRIGSMLNVPSNLGVRPQQSPGPGSLAGGEDSDEGPRVPMLGENGPSSSGGPRTMEGYYRNGGILWGFPPQQPVPQGVSIPVMGPNFLISPSLPSVRFNHINQGGAVAGGGPPLGGLPMSPHHLSPGSGPKL